MATATLGKKGQVSIPRAVLERLDLVGEVTLIVETTDDGAIVLRPAALYPIETYSDERLREFEEADGMAPAMRARVAKALGKRR